MNTLTLCRVGDTVNNRPETPKKRDKVPFSHSVGDTVYWINNRFDTCIRSGVVIKYEYDFGDVSRPCYYVLTEAGIAVVWQSKLVRVNEVAA